MIMLDTNICIYVLKKHPPSVLEKFEQVSELHISSIVYAELWTGIENSPKKLKAARTEQLEYFLSFLAVESWNETAARAYADIHAHLKQKGLMIGNMDLLIAAHAKSLGATLVTNNVREFERVPGLIVENWL